MSTSIGLLGKLSRCSALDKFAETLSFDLARTPDFILFSTLGFAISGLCFFCFSAFPISILATVSMSSQASPKRNMKKYARDASRRKFSLNVDLNDPPVIPEIRQPVGASGAAQGRVAVPEVVTSGMAVLPIDVEAIEDDDIQLLSSPRDFNQARNQTRKNRPLLLLDENLELSIGPSVNVDNHLSRVPPNSFRRRRRFSPNSIIINCDAYVNVEDDDINAKRTKVASPRAEPEKVMMPKETVFSCPICINSLVDACSTICGHVFCQACIKQAIKAQKKCPTCRRKLTANNFHRVFLPTSS